MQPTNASKQDHVEWQPPLPPRGVLLPPVQSGRAVVGQIVTSGNPGRILTYASILERDLLYILLTSWAVVDVIEQAARLEYTDADGEMHEHVIDTLAVQRDGTRVGYAVKYEEQVRKSGIANVVARLNAQRTDFADRYELVTEAHIRRNGRHTNARLFHAYRRCRIEHEIAMAMHGTESLRGAAALCDLADDLAFSGAFRALVGLVDDGVLKQVKPGPIVPETLVHRTVLN